MLSCNPFYLKVKIFLACYGQFSFVCVFRVILQYLFKYRMYPNFHCGTKSLQNIA